MNFETQHVEMKSLRVLTGDNPKWGDLACDCVAFANAQGGFIRIGIEDKDNHPPQGQVVPDDLAEKLHRRISELTVNVSIVATKKTSEKTKGKFLEVQVFRSPTPASTTDGKFYQRVSNTSVPLTGSEIQRLLNERNAEPWETQTGLNVSRDAVNHQLFSRFASDIRASERVKQSVKEKNDSELLDHYFLARGDKLTNLGILCIGLQEDRARLGTAPIIQYIKYDDDRRKIHKLVWDDHSFAQWNSSLKYGAMSPISRKATRCPMAFSSTISRPMTESWSGNFW